VKSSGPVVMCVDPGIAHVGVGIVARYGARLDLVDSTHIDTPPNEEADDRERRIWLRLATLAREYRPSLIGYEDQRGVNVGARMNAKRAVEAARRGQQGPALGFGANNDLVFEVVGIVKAVCWSYGATLARYTAQQAKKSVAGDGRAEKTTVRDAIRHYFPGYERLQGKVLDLNECDAIAGAIHCERVSYLSGRVRRTG
jgi:Holliday junction resolvasome RuvABC endonuclease subunit